MGMVWELKSVPYQTHIYEKDTYFVKFYTVRMHIWEWSGVTVPYQSHMPLVNPIPAP